MEKDNTGWSGGIPYGYRYNHDLNSLETNIGEKNIVLKVLELRRKGLGANNIAHKLNELGLKSRSGKDWSNIAVGYLLKETRLLHYAGYFPNGKKGYWEAFISKNEIKDLASEKENRQRAKKDEYLLSGLNIFKCGYCGSSVKSSITFRKDGSKAAYYVCTNRSMKGTSVCSKSKMVRQEVVNSLVLNDIVVKHSNIVELEKQYEAASKTRLKEADEAVSKKQSQMRELLKKSIETGSNKELFQIKQMLSELLRENEDTIKSAIQEFDFNQFKKSSIKRIKALDISTQKELLSTYIGRIEMLNDRAIIVYKFNIKSELMF